MDKTKLVSIILAAFIGSGLFIQEAIFSKNENTALAASNIARVWAVDDSEKVKQEDLSNPLANDYLNNKVWNGNKVSIFGGKNEIVAFQLILEGGSSGANSVEVKLDKLANQQYTIQNDPISAGDPFDYRGKRIELFIEGYVNVTSRGTNWYSNAMPLPNSEFLGMMPDALIPYEAASSKGGAPFNIAPQKNQGIWFDIYIPKTTPAGTYAGTINVLVNGSSVYQLPIELRVYNFTIPDENHDANFFNGQYSSLNEKHRAIYSLSDPNYKLLEGRYFQMAHRHRIDLTFNTNLPNMVSHYGRYITGAYYTSQNKYDGPGIGTPHTAYSIWTYPGVETITSRLGYKDTEEGWRQLSDDWVNWFEQNAPSTQYFKYMYDEPQSHSDDPGREMDMLFALIRERADWVHNNPGPGKRLKIYVTTYMNPTLFGYIDFWGLSGSSGYSNSTNPAYENGTKAGYQISLAPQRQALGDKVGVYNGARPSFPAGYTIDSPGSEYRALSWTLWKYNIDQYFYHRAMRWNYGDSTTRNPFQSPTPYTDPSYQMIGSGLIFYPGEQKDFAGSADDKGLFGPIASVRMKTWRRGAQDYEYLWLAKRAGLNTSSIVNTIIPCAFDDYCGSYTSSRTSQPIWQKRGYAYESARLQLAQLLDPIGSRTPIVDTTPPASPTGVSIALKEPFFKFVFRQINQYLENNSFLGYLSSFVSRLNDYLYF